MPIVRSSRFQYSFAIALLLVAGPALAQGRWTTETRLPKATQEISATALNGQVWVAAGSLNQARTTALWSYDPATKVWTSHAPYPGTARDHAALVTVGGFLYLIGGVTAWPAPSVASVNRYDPSTNTWTTMAPLPIARGAMGVAVLNGKIYAAGGLVSGSSVNDFTVYDPATNTWSNLPDMSTSRDHLAAVALNGKFYAMGGRVIGNTCSPMNLVEIFDPATNSWSVGTPMLHAHGGHAVGTVNGHIQVFGGEGNATNCGTIAASEDFDPATNTWTALPEMPTPRHGIAGATIGTSVYMPGGATWTGDSGTSAHERYDSSGTSTAGPVPAPWASLDVGSTSIPGRDQFDNGVFHIQSAGANIWDAADSFRFVYQPLSGDGRIVARVESLGFTNAHAKAGVMIRESLNANSKNVVLDSQPDNTIEFNTRSSTAGTTVKLTGGTVNEPVYLRLDRAGSTISAFVSADGVNWTATGTTTLSTASTVYVGLAVCSHLTTKATSATIDHVTVTGSGGNTPPAVSITSPADAATFTAPATIAIAASASDNDGTIASVEFLADGTPLKTDTTSPYSATWSNVPAGSYTLTAVATDNSGTQTTSAPVNITVATGGGGTLPSPWQDLDIGAVGAAGGASYSNGVFTVRGAGADIWNTADGFHFVYQPLDGDGSITARVVSVQNVYVWTKAGVMIRNTLEANSAHGHMLVSAAKGEAFQYRTQAGGTSLSAAGAAAPAPYWVKVVRSGNVLTGYPSAPGNYLTGLLDEVAVYHTQLSDQDVAWHYHANH